ncbi:metallophosphoesterase [Parvularcula sp. LCG005]|uniref:metallophosphoesterase n=1 Tax=Parvularcula sp. LCG005 TaxID=3078805 RepID=UPI002942830A|nr:metallophosphoesterase [Parvularcula sp. LCG005]WOI54386.1 metallophosphoesterase [Parvularcula sp. LCG005]
MLELVMMIPGVVGPRKGFSLIADNPYGSVMIWWLSFLIIPVVLGLLWTLWKKPRWRILAGLLMVPALFGFYARFIEPHRLVIAEHTVRICGEGLPGTLTAAVVSDMHSGLYSNSPSISRIVRTLNNQAPDFVLMPGDFTNFLAEKHMDRAMAPFMDLDMPAYAVLGNHDFGLPGHDVEERLQTALEKSGVTVLNPGSATFGAHGKYVRIVGMQDFYELKENRPDFSPDHGVSPLPTILLEHNPDLIKTGRTGPFDLFVAGHTHGGQILLPFITCTMTFACDTLRYGYEETPAGKLFVTSGTGMSGVPLRFGVPPKIDMVTMEIDRCRVDAIRNPMLAPNLPLNSPSMD